MTLKEFRKQNNITGKDMAKRLNITPVTLSRIENEICEPSFATLVNIRRVTDGQVDVDDFVPEVPEKKAS